MKKQVLRMDIYLTEARKNTIIQNANIEGTIYYSM